MKTTCFSRAGPTLSVLVLFVGMSFAIRQAPFCVDVNHQSTDKSIHQDLLNFEEIFERHRKNNTFVAVSPNGVSSPSGFIQNISLSHITTLTPELPLEHNWRIFNNFIHIVINTSYLSDGMEGLYVQAISAPLGVPFGEFVTNFDCHDCRNKPSAMAEHTALIPCTFRPAASYIHPTVLVIGGKNVPDKFKEAHFHFRYVDYPCFDVMYAQFLIIAVRQFKPLQYETFFSPMYQTNIEGIGAPSPMYYGWETKDIDCHDPLATSMDNWFAQKNRLVKIRYNQKYDECVTAPTHDGYLGHNVCPPGPVTCGSEKGSAFKAPRTVSQWRKMRRDYIDISNPKGTPVFCLECGNYTPDIGKPPFPWGDPPDDDNLDDDVEISIREVTIKRTIRVKPRYQGKNCEQRDGFGKTENDSRDVSKDKAGCELDFKTRLVNGGYRWGQRSLLLHGLLMIFAFTIGTNCLIYTARFLKEANIIDKGSGCWGIGNWLWGHIFWGYLCGAAMWAGFTMYAFQIKRVVCELYNSKEETDFCNRTIFYHKLLGTVAVLGFHVSYGTGFIRPKGGKTRISMMWAHTLTGYISKYVAFICIILIPESEDWVSITLILLMEISFWILFVIGTKVQKMMDKELNEDRKMIPVPEGVVTHSDPPYGKMRGLLYPALFTLQFALYMILFLYTLRDKKG